MKCYTPVLFYADDVDIHVVGESVHTMKKNTEAWRNNDHKDALFFDLFQ
jgi:hypothetical protein